MYRYRPIINKVQAELWGAGPYPPRTILEVQRLIRFMPKVVVCLVNGWAAGGGHSLHVTCDLTLASAEHARFKQTDADVGSFDGGYGSAYLARQVGQKFAREIFFLADEYDAEEMHRMGAVNRVVEHVLSMMDPEPARRPTAAIAWAQQIIECCVGLVALHGLEVHVEKGAQALQLAHHLGLGALLTSFALILKAQYARPERFKRTEVIS